MTQAADLARELTNKLEQSIGEAQKLQREEQRDRQSTRRWVISVAVALASLAIGFFVGRQDDPEGKERSEAGSSEAQQSQKNRR
jgi:hypothetical protein